MDLNLKNTTYKQLLWIGMASITLFFAGLTSAVIVRSSESGCKIYLYKGIFGIVLL